MFVFIDWVALQASRLADFIFSIRIEGVPIALLLILLAAAFGLLGGIFNSKDD